MPHHFMQVKEKQINLRRNYSGADSQTRRWMARMLKGSFSLTQIISIKTKQLGCIISIKTKFLKVDLALCLRNLQSWLCIIQIWNSFRKWVFLLTPAKRLRLESLSYFLQSLLTSARFPTFGARVIQEISALSCSMVGLKFSVIFGLDMFEYENCNCATFNATEA